MFQKTRESPDLPYINRNDYNGRRGLSYEINLPEKSKGSEHFTQDHHILYDDGLHKFILRLQTIVPSSL